MGLSHELQKTLKEKCSMTSLSVWIFVGIPEPSCQTRLYLIKQDSDNYAWNLYGFLEGQVKKVAFG